MEFTCYKCGCDSYERTLFLVRSIGIFHICTKCIEEQEKETGLVGVLSYSKGLFFTTKEEADKLINERST